MVESSFFMLLLEWSLFDFDRNLPHDVITPYVVLLSMALPSSPPVSSTQYCFPFHCHKVNKQWISGRAAPRNNARCTVQRKSNRVKSVISLPETSSERGEEFKKERLERKTEPIRNRRDMDRGGRHDDVALGLGKKREGKACWGKAERKNPQT